MISELVDETASKSMQRLDETANQPIDAIAD